MRTARIVARYIWALVVASAAVTTLLHGIYPDSEIWTDFPVIFFLIAAVTFFSALVPAVARANRERNAENNLERQKDLQLTINAAFLRLLRITGFQIEQFGVHAYLIDKPASQLWIPELRFVAGLKLPLWVESDVRWRKGKGVLGACWQNREWTIWDCHASYEMAQTLSPDQWNALQPQTRLNLTYEEVRQTRDHGTIAAQPIFDGAKEVVGCVALLAPPGTTTVLEQPAVRSEVAQLSAAVWIALH